MEENMRKLIICILTLLTFATCFSACGKKNEGTTSTSESTPAVVAPDFTIDLSHNEVSLLVGGTFQLSAEISKNRPILWRVQDTRIATVSDDGLVTALAS